MECIENQNIMDIKSVTAEHPKTSHKLFKTIRQAKKILHVNYGYKNSTSSLNSQTAKPENLFNGTKSVKKQNSKTNFILKKVR